MGKQENFSFSHTVSGTCQLHEYIIQAYTELGRKDLTTYFPVYYVPPGWLSGECVGLMTW